MSQPKFEQAWMEWKAERTQKVDNDYKQVIKKLHKKPLVRYRRNLDEGGKKKNYFQKSGSGNLSNWTPSHGQHTYLNASKRTTRPSYGKSFKVGEKGLRLLPYDLLVT